MNKRLPYSTYIGTWTSKTYYVDIETGETITQSTFKKHYIVLKTTRKIIINENKTKGCIEYTKQCRKDPQRRINFSS